MAVVKLNPQKLPTVAALVGILSGAGGVGKTFVTVNLALSLAKSGLKVGILDANISSSNVLALLGIREKISTTPDNKLKPVERYGIKAIAMEGMSQDEEQPAMWRGPINSKIIQQFLKETLWGQLDVLLIDFPPGMPDHSLSLLQQWALDGVILVTTPTRQSLRDTKRIHGLIIALDVPLLGVIENMRSDIFGDGTSTSFTQQHDTNLLGSIPLRKQIVAASDNGEVALLKSEELEMIFAKIARNLKERMPEWPNA